MSRSLARKAEIVNLALGVNGAIAHLAVLESRNESAKSYSMAEAMGLIAEVR